MDVSLDQVSESQAEQKEMVEAWNKFVTRVKGEMDMLERQVSEKVEMGGLSLEAAMNELADAMAHAREDSTAAVEKMAWVCVGFGFAMQFLIDSRPSKIPFRIASTGQRIPSRLG